MASTRFRRPATVSLIDQVLKLRAMAASTRIAEDASNTAGRVLGTVSVRTGRLGSVAMMMRMGSRRLRASYLRMRVSSGAAVMLGAVGMT